MAMDASQMLGMPQIAGVLVNPRGLASATAAPTALAAGGPLVGTLAAGVIQDAESDPGREETPRFGRAAWLAVTERDLALVKLKGLVKAKLDEVIAKISREDVTAIELGDGKLTRPMVIAFADGTHWQLEVAPQLVKRAQSVIEALQTR